MQPKMFLIKKRSGIIYNFYFSQTGGICYKLYSLHNNEKVDPFEISITEEKILEFHVTIDNEDGIHILALTESGDLKYFASNEDIWNSKVFSHFDLRSNIVKSLFIHVVNQKLYIIYAASNLINVNLWTIYFKCWDGVKWHNTSIGMALCNKELQPYCATVDNHNNIHVIYKNSSHKGTQLFYRKFHSQFSLWSSPEKTVNSTEVIGFYYIFCDMRSHLHLAWSTSTGTSFKMLYKKFNKKLLNHNHQNRMTTLNMSKQAYLQPVIFEIEQTIWVMWKKQQEFFGCKIEPNGLSGSVVSSVQRPHHASPLLVEFVSNYEMEKQSFNGRLFYGVADDFIDLMLPKSYTCDLYESISEELPDPSPAEPESSEINSTDASDVSDEPEAAAVIPPCNQLTIELSESFDEIKLNYDKITGLLEEVMAQLTTQDVSNTLRDIQVQNKVLIELLTGALKEAAETEKNKPNGPLKKLLDLFK